MPGVRTPSRVCPGTSAGSSGRSRRSSPSTSGPPAPACGTTAAPATSPCSTATDGKLRGCDLIKRRVSEVHLGDGVRLRTTVVQHKTGRPVPLKLTDPTRDALAAWLETRGLRSADWLFPSRSHTGDHITTRQYTPLGRRLGRAGRLGPGSLRHPRWRWPTSGRAACGRASSCAATRSWRARSGTSASRSTTPRSCRSRSTCEQGRGGPAPPRVAEMGEELKVAARPKAPVGFAPMAVPAGL